MKLPIRRPMKGEAIESLEQVQFPKWASVKIDGFRCVLHDHPLTSRFSRFPNEYFHNQLKGILPPGYALDSEAVVGRNWGAGVLSRTSSGLTTRTGEPKFKLWVFDRPDLIGQLGWYDRYTEARKLIEQLDHPRIRLLKHYLIRDVQDAQEFLDESLDREYEGVMFRDEDGPYKEGKSTIKQGWLLKCKPFDTAEGRIKGWFEEMKNGNAATRELTGKLKRSSAKAGKKAKGSLGGFILDDLEDRVEVRVGGGFTKDQREQLWRMIQGGWDPTGILVRYKKQRMGEKDKPRHPNFVEFVDFRPEWDMS